MSKRLRLSGFILIIACVFFLVYKVRSVLIPFTLGAVITYLLNPLVLAFQRRGAPRGVAILLIYISFILVIATAVGVVLPNVTRELTQLADVLPEQTVHFQAIIEKFYERYARYDIPLPIRHVAEDAVSKLESQLLRLVRSTVQGVLNFLSNIFSFILAPIIAFYLTKDLEGLKKKFADWLPAQYRNEILHVMGEVDLVLGGYIRGQLIICGLITILATLGLTVLKVNFALILGVIAGITNIIPYFGPFIGSAPALAVALLNSPFQALYVAILFIAVHEVESGIISPRILGEHVGLHPLAVILAILAAGKLFGSVGLIIGVPMAAVLKVVFGRVWKLLLN